jgi:hypothetical protein
MNRRLLAAVPAIALVCASVPALARGGGGGFGGGGGGFGGGWGGHGGFAAHGAGFAYRGHAGGGGTTRTTAFTTHSKANATVVPPIRPEVIYMPHTIGSNAIVPPLTGAPVVPPFTGAPVVPPFGIGTAVAPYARLPVVATPYGNPAAYGYGFIGGAADETQIIIASPEIRAASVPGTPQSARTDVNPAQPETPHEPCHPVPSGYHCDWSS